VTVDALLRYWRIAFGAIALMLLAAEAYVLLFDRHAAFEIHGTDEYPIAAFSERTPVRHAFLMNGDGLRSVSVLVSGDRGARTTVKWTLWRGTPDEPKTMAVAAEGQDTFELGGRRQWRSYEMIRDGSSHDRWYTIEIAMIDLAPAAARVDVIATRDNPDRGGVLWVGAARQPGSLVLRADRLGRTPYQRFRLEAERNLPPVLQSGSVQWLAVTAYHLAFFAVAYAFVKEAVTWRRPRREAVAPGVALNAPDGDDHTLVLPANARQAAAAVQASRRSISTEWWRPIAAPLMWTMARLRQLVRR